VGKSPAFQYYPKDFLADTVLLSAEEVGVYWLLLSSAWVGLPGVPQCHLPNDDVQLAKIGRVGARKWANFSKRLKSFFIEVRNKNGKLLLLSTRLQHELDSQNRRKSLARKAARSRWNKPDKEKPHDFRNADAMRTGMRTQCTASAPADAVADESASASSSSQNKNSNSSKKKNKRAPFTDPPEEIEADLVERWNGIPDVAKVRVMTDKRRRACRTRLRDSDFRSGWQDAINKLAASDFCRGQGETGWIATLDWFLKPDSVNRLLEGQYDNRSPAQKTSLDEWMEFANDET
jgi:uncharacterized protein YdaU (DUF1376 family)